MEWAYFPMGSNALAILTRTPGGIMTKQEQIAELKMELVRLQKDGKWKRADEIYETLKYLLSPALPIEKEVRE
jgi:hypothetical protein